MRLLLFLLAIANAAGAAEVADPVLAEALKQFRADPPPGWSYTLRTVGEGKSTVERCDAEKPEFDRWSLVQKDGRPPTVDEARKYAEGRSRRSRGGTAPKVIDQLDLATLQRSSSQADRPTYECRLKAREAGDNVAGFLRATVIVYTPTRTIEALQLRSVSEFSPTFVVRITEMNTDMTYSLPVADRPSLPQQVKTRVRGRAFLFKSLDEEMTMTFSEYAWAGKPR